MPTNRKVIDFKIHNLTEEQFQELKEAGQIDPNAIYCTPDETVANFEAVNARIDEAIQTEQQHNIEINTRVDETVANFEEINKEIEAVNTEIEALKDKVGIPLLTPMWTDHKLNDISWLNADTFSWQSGDVYKAAYEHLASEAIFESETKKYVRVKTLNAAHDGWREDNNIYYREPSYDFTSGEEQYEGYIFAWVATGSDSMVVTNTETPAEYDVVHYYSKMYPEEPSPSRGRVTETGEETFYSNAETETIDGITITFCRAEDGHKICPVTEEANIQALYEKTGVAWYYILDADNKQFKLPRTKFGFTGLRDSVGKYVPAGVPDITGRAEVVGYTTTAGGAWSTGGSLSGNIWTRKTAGAVNESGYEFDGQLRFNASHSNSIYGNSNTVQPPATQMYLYFYVGNFERDALEQTAGITSEQLNNKADVTDVVELQNNKLDKSAEISLVPTGSVTAFAGTTPPTGWLKCDGSAISRTTYAKLFAAIGTKYGSGNGSTTFNLPTQSVLPLGTNATVSVYGNGKSLGLTTGDSNGSVRYWDTKLIADKNIGATLPATKGGNWAPTTDRLFGIVTNASLSGITGSVNLANATGAKAIVCIKY